MEIKVLELTLKDVEEVAFIHTQVWKSAYHGILPDSFLRDISLEKRIQLRQKIYFGNMPNAESRISLVAKLNGVTVGFCDGGASHNSLSDAECELYALYVLDKYQRNGVASALFKELSHHFAAKSHQQMCLWVLRDNIVARRFYDHKAGKIVAKKMIGIDGTDYPSVCYVFNLPQ